MNFFDFRVMACSVPGGEARKNRTSLGPLTKRRLLIFAAPPRRCLSDCVADDLRQIADHTFERLLQAANIVGDAVHFVLDAIEARLYGRQIIGVAPGLFQNVTCDELLALDFAFEYAGPRHAAGLSTREHPSSGSVALTHDLATFSRKGRRKI